MSSDDDPEEDEPLDPRIQAELEKLNKAALLINQLEVAVDDARATWRQLLSESTQNLDGLSKKLGSCIEKAKPYYEAHSRAAEVQIQVQKAAARYERAIGMQAAAREMVELAEQSHASNGKKQPTSMDSAALEVLNHATIKVMQAESDKLDCEIEHKKLSSVFLEEQETANALAKELKKHISKSKPYYDMVHRVHKCLEDQKAVVEKLERDVVAAKAMYNKALQRLEAISNDIHLRRQQASVASSLGKRSQGVGSESPLPPATLMDSAAVAHNGDVSKPSECRPGAAIADGSSVRSGGINDDVICVEAAACHSSDATRSLSDAAGCLNPPSSSSGSSPEPLGAQQTLTESPGECSGDGTQANYLSGNSAGSNQVVAEPSCLCQPVIAAAPDDKIDGTTVSPSDVDVVFIGGEDACKGIDVAMSASVPNAERMPALEVRPSLGLQGTDTAAAAASADDLDVSGDIRRRISSPAPSSESPTWKRTARRLSDGERHHVPLSALHGMIFGLSLDSSADSDNRGSVDKAYHQHPTLDRRPNTLRKITYDQLPPPLAHLQQHYNQQQRASLSDPEVSADLSRIIACLLSDEAASLV